MFPKLLDHKAKLRMRTILIRRVSHFIRGIAYRQTVDSKTLMANEADAKYLCNVATK